MRLPNRNILLWVGVLFAGSGVTACKKKAPPPPPVVEKAPAPVNLDQLLQEELAALPEFVDKDVYKGLLNISRRCQVDTFRSSVECPNDYFTNIIKLLQRGLKPRHSTLQTASYAFANGNDKVKTAAAEMLSRAYGNAKGTTPDAKVSRKLIAQLGELPEAQAIDAAPAITYAAMKMNLEQELFEVLDKPGRERVAAAGYRHMMVDGRLRVFEKVWDLVKSKHTDLAVAAVEAPRIMGGRTPEENQQLCDWMKSLTKDERGVIATRATTFLAGCGTKYLDFVLAEDEKRLANKQPPAAGLEIYRDVCASDTKNPYGNATKAQCSRLRKLATAVVNDQSSGEMDRVQALGLLAQQFPGKDTLALATKMAGAEQPELSRKAQATLRDLERQEQTKRN